MPIALDPTRPFRYVLRGDRKEADPAFFMLQPLTHGQSKKVSQTTDRDAFEGMTLALRYGLKGWGNFRDLDGKDVDFDLDQKGEASEAALSRIRLNDKTGKVERVGGITAVRPRIGERPDHVEELDDRARPTVRDDDRERVGFR